MYIDAEDIKLYMDLEIHQEIANFINKSVQEGIETQLGKLREELQGLLAQELSSNDLVSDVGIGLGIALARVDELLEENEESGGRWIPCITEKYPKSGEYVLLSFANFSLPTVGRYEEDEEGGAFYIGDEDESCISQEMIVNAWMPLPKCYGE